MIRALTFAKLLLISLLFWPSWETLAQENQQKVYVIGYSSGSRFHLEALPRVQAMYDRAGLQVVFKPLPTKRVLVTANEGGLDGNMARIPSITKIYKNLRQIDVPLIELTGSAYGMAPAIGTVDDALLLRSRVGAVRGVLWSEERLKGFEVRYANNIELLVKMLLQNRLDIILATSANAESVIERMGEAALNIRTLKPPQYSTTTYHYVHKKNEEIIPLLEQALRSLITEGAWN